MNINKQALLPRCGYKQARLLLMGLGLALTLLWARSSPPTEPVIVIANDITTAVAAVTEVGGTITHELGVINAVGARVTASQYGRLARLGHLRLVHDHPLEISTEGGPHIIRDQFNVLSYTNNNGSQSWLGPWTEGGENNGPLLGNIRVAINHLVVQNNNRSLQRSVDLSATTAATLSINYRRDSFDDANDYVLVEMSANDGAAWTEVGRLTGPGNDQNWQTAVYDITPYTAANTILRLRTSPSLGALDRLMVDDLQIQSYTGQLRQMTLRDSFSGLAYSSNNGTVSWRSAWQEIGENDGPIGGLVSLLSSSLCLDNCLSINSQGQSINNTGLWREADLSGATAATLSFDYQRLLPGNNPGSISLQISKDGGVNWTTLHLFDLSLSDATLLRQTFDITPHAAANTRIRFIGAGDALGSSFLVDNVQIEFLVDDIPGTTYTTHIGADQLHNQGITGNGITVAVIDTGYWSHPGLDYPTGTSTLALSLGGLQTMIALGNTRVLAHYDAIQDQLETNVTPGYDSDTHGHGAHVSSIIVNSEKSDSDVYNGIAPDANLVAIKAFGADGAGSYLDVIRGIEWAITYKDTYHIRVLNLSFSAPPQSYYWDDPLNQAVMRAWQAGIVVVVAAGNRGPAAMTVGVPGNVPYVISVGAMSDNGTAGNLTDDFLTSFSSVGPTVEGFIKPEMVAPGGHLLGIVGPNTTLAQHYPQFREGEYMTLSGTSQATAVTSGVAALMLQHDPSLTPDDVKCRLMSAAHTAVNPDGTLAYSIFQQGAGQINAYDAVYSTASGCANQGLDIAADLDGSMHFGGPANMDEDGNYYIMDTSGYMWAGGYMWAENYHWDETNTWNSTTAGMQEWVPQE